MAEDKPKTNYLQKLLDLLKKLVGLIFKPIQILARILSKVIRKILLNPIVVAIVVGSVMFVLGARLHETGNLAGYMDKDHAGATVLVTGVCKNLRGKNRMPALGADFVTVTSESKEKLKGVLRKTREVLECDKSEITYSAMPYELVRDVFKSPPNFPDLPPAMEREEAPPEYLKLSKKTLIISGTCSKQDGSSLPPFTDKAVDVTDIKRSDVLEDGFDLYGIRREDQQAIKCLSTAIKYDLKTDEMMMAERGTSLLSDKREPLVGKILMISGTCVPDKRVAKRSKYAFFKFANVKVQVLEEAVDENNELKKFVGLALDKEYLGETVVCDKTKWPFIYQVFDDAKHKLDEMGTKTQAISNQEGE